MAGMIKNKLFQVGAAWLLVVLLRALHILLRDIWLLGVYFPMKQHSSTNRFIQQ